MTCFPFRCHPSETPIQYCEKCGRVLMLFRGASTPNPEAKRKPARRVRPPTNRRAGKSLWGRYAND